MITKASLSNFFNVFDELQHIETKNKTFYSAYFYAVKRKLTKSEQALVSLFV